MKEENNKQVENEKQNVNVEKGKKRSLILAIAIILFVIGAAAGAFFYLKSPARIVNMTLNKVVNSVDELSNVNGVFDIEKDTISVNGDLKVETSVPEFSFLKDNKLTYNFGADFAHEKMELGLSLLENNKNVLDVTAYMKDNKEYILLKDIFTSIIATDNEIDMDEILPVSSFNSILTKDEIKYLVNFLKDLLTETIKVDDFQSSSEQVELNGKITTLNKLSYTLTQKDIIALSRNAVDKALQDTKVLAILAKLSGETNEEYREELVEQKQYMGEYASYMDAYSYGEYYTIGIYTTRILNSLAGFEINANGETKISAIFDNSIAEINVIAQNSKLITAIVTMKDSNNYSINVNCPLYNATAKLDIYTKQIDAKNSEASIKLALNINGQTYTITSNNKAIVGKEIANNVDTSKVKNASELTEEEQEAISNGLMNNLQGTKIYALISQMMPNTAIIDEANVALQETEINLIQQVASLAWASAYADGNRTQKDLEDAVMNYFENYGITDENLANYIITVTTSGVTVKKK